MIHNAGKQLQDHDLRTVKQAGDIHLIHDLTTDLWTVATYREAQGRWEAPAAGGGIWTGPLSYVASWGSRSAAYRRFRAWTTPETLADYMEA